MFDEDKDEGSEFNAKEEELHDYSSMPPKDLPPTQNIDSTVLDQGGMSQGLNKGESPSVGRNRRIPFRLIKELDECRVSIK